MHLQCYIYIEIFSDIRGDISWCAVARCPLHGLLTTVDTGEAVQLEVRKFMESLITHSSSVVAGPNGINFI